MNVIKGIYVFFGCSISAFALCEPAPTLPGELNYGEFCQINVKKFCDVTNCSAEEIQQSESPAASKVLGIL